MSSSPFDLSMLLGRLLGSSPFIVVAFAGFVLCFVRESRPDRARLAVGGALAVYLAGSLILPLLYGYILQHMQVAMSGGPNAGMIVISLLSSSTSAVALGLLLYAAFTNDDPPAATAGP